MLWRLRSKDWAHLGILCITPRKLRPACWFILCGNRLAVVATMWVDGRNGLASPSSRTWRGQGIRAGIKTAFTAEGGRRRRQSAAKLFAALKEKKWPFLAKPIPP